MSMPPRSTELQTGYYDSLDETSLGGRETRSDAEARKSLEQFLVRIPPGGSVLDAGTGAGVEAAIIEQSGRKVYPVDLSKKMLGKARRHGWNAETTSHFERMTNADTFSLPFGDATFDAVVSKDVISLGGLGERLEIIEELKRVLKPGGRILLVVEEIPESIIVVNGEERRGRKDDLLGDLTAEDVFDYATQVEIDATQVRSTLREAGFKGIRAKTIQKRGGRWISDRLVVAEATK